MPGVVIQDPATGRIRGSRPQTLEERFPTGRKHCARCGCWRHLCDFGPKGQWIQSWCRACQRTHARGHDRPRVPRSRMVDLQRKREDWVAQIAWIKSNPELYQAYLEEQRIRQWDRRRAAGIPERPRRKDLGPIVLVDPAPFLAWLDREPRDLTDTETRFVQRLRSGESRRASLPVIDSIMTRHGAAIWMQQLYPPEPNGTDPSQGP